MKLKSGEWVRVEKGDDLDGEGRCGFAVLHDVEVEWNGRHFLGCTPRGGGPRIQYSRAALLRRLMRARDPEEPGHPFVDVHGMIEQLVGSGMWP